MHPIRILFQAAFFGGLPRFRFVGESDVPSPTSSWGELGLGCFGGLPLLRFAGGSPDAPSSGTFLGCAITEIRRAFGKKFGRAYFRRSTPFPLLASRWGNFGRGSGCARSTLLVLAALGTTATPFRRCRCEAWERNKANREPIDASHHRSLQNKANRRGQKGGGGLTRV